MKIYISLQESESLIFQKILIINKERPQLITRRRDIYSVLLGILPEKIVEQDDKLIIFSSIVDFFEIPEKEEILFLNHYNVPYGKIKTIDRDVRDENPNLLSTLEEKQEQELPAYYLPIRNSLLNMYKIVVEGAVPEKVGLETINSFSGLSEFRKRFLKEILKTGFFPLERITTPEFRPDQFFRFTWWVKFLQDSILLSHKDEMGEEEYSANKKWFAGFMDPQDSKKISASLDKRPKFYEKDWSFFFGYYIAAVNFEIANQEDPLAYYESYIKKIEFSLGEEVKLWALFFHSLFDEDLISLYFINGVQEQVLKIEKLGYNFDKTDIEEELEVEYVQLSKDQQISQYIELTEGEVKTAPTLVSPNELKSIFENNLFENNLQNIGLEIPSGFTKVAVPNTISMVNGIFRMEVRSLKPSDVSFYFLPESLLPDHLEGMKIKLKPLSKLIDKKKKVLVGFLKGKNTVLLNTYGQIINSVKERIFEKVIIVWTINRDQEEVQSTDFDQERKQIEDRFQQLFGLETILLIKNKRNFKDEEIKRNLKNLLADYKSNQIEVVDENFDINQARWLVSRNAEFFIEENSESQYYFFQNNL